MPRAEFSSLLELKKWLKVMMDRGRKYIAFVTDKNELIIQPTTSTAPVTYGYAPEVTESVKGMVTGYGIPLVKVKRFEWTSENQIKKE